MSKIIIFGISDTEKLKHIESAFGKMKDARLNFTHEEVSALVLLEDTVKEIVKESTK